jgi:hypothetical protein
MGCWFCRRITSLVCCKRHGNYAVQIICLWCSTTWTKAPGCIRLKDNYSIMNLEWQTKYINSVSALYYYFSHLFWAEFWFYILYSRNIIHIRNIFIQFCDNRIVIIFSTCWTTNKYTLGLDCRLVLKPIPLACDSEEWYEWSNFHRYSMVKCHKQESRDMGNSPWVMAKSLNFVVDRSSILPLKWPSLATPDTYECTQKVCKQYSKTMTECD